MVDTNDEWILSRTGISERRLLGKGLGTSDMGAPAVKKLLAKTNTDSSEIDLIVCATVTPDMPFPATANLIAHKIGATCASFDIGAACSGFLYALTTGAKFIESGTYKKVIVVGADKMSSIIDYQDRNTCVLFGDGAGAVLLEPNYDGFGIKDTILCADGAGAEHLHMKAGGSVKPASHETDGRTVFKFAVTKMAGVAHQIMEQNQLTADDVRYLVPHQANKRIIDATAKRMGVSSEKVMLNIQKYGNTTAGTIPICLWEWEKDLKKGDNLILAAFGGGFTWGSVYLKWAYDSEA
ncbi:UNVERIFIED_CONTAM: hypothetical protein GTU68_006077 [Idotea baltica]|nr:hypothetical protein [Idotea baltica]